MCFRHARKVFLILAATVLLGACGQTGPLVLPDDRAANDNIEATPANANE